MNKKQRVFIDEYLQCWNGAEAARRAGYAHPRVQAVRLLADINIKKYVDEAMREKAMGAEEVLARLAEQARADGSKYINEGGLVDVEAIVADGKQHLIKSIKQRNKGEMWWNEVEFYDAQAALVHIGKAQALFSERVQHEGNVNLIWDLPIPGTLDSPS